MHSLHAVNHSQTVYLHVTGAIRHRELRRWSIPMHLIALALSACDTSDTSNTNDASNTIDRLTRVARLIRTLQAQQVMWVESATHAQQVMRVARLIWTTQAQQVMRMTRLTFTGSCRDVGYMPTRCCCHLIYWHSASEIGSILHRCVHACGSADNNFVVSMCIRYLLFDCD